LGARVEADTGEVGEIQRLGRFVGIADSKAVVGATIRLGITKIDATHAHRLLIDPILKPVVIVAGA
jgi:hypothetical protein